MFKDIVFCMFFVQSVSGMIQPVNNSDEKLDVCIARVMDKVFQEEFVVHAIIDESYNGIQLNVNYPMVIWNVNAEAIESSSFGRNFLIQVSSLDVLRNALERYSNSSLWDPIETPKGTFLVIANAMEVQGTFQVLWEYKVHNAVILVNEENDVKLYQSNPKSMENDCGKTARDIYGQNCNTELNITFRKGFRNYIDCPIYFSMYSYVNHETKSKRDSARHLTVNAVIDKFQMHTIKMKLIKGHDAASDVVEVANKNEMVYDEKQVSQIMVREKWVWIVPSRKRVSALEVYVIIFQKEVWFMVVGNFCLIVLFYLIFLALFKGRISISDLTLINLQMFSISLWGSYGNFVKFQSIRLLLLFYTFYSVVIQTGYVSHLIRVLTTPQYENGINTLTELFRTNLPIYSSDVFSYPCHNNSLCTSIQYDFFSYWKKWKDLAECLKDNTCVTVLGEDLAVLIIFEEDLYQNHLIFDVSHLGSVEYVFQMEKGHYILDILNAVVTAFTENGVYDRIDRDCRSAYDKVFNAERHSIDPQVLTLEHVYGIFIIWAFGLGVSLIVFIFELLIHYLSRCYNRLKRNHIVPAVREAFW